VTIVNGGLPPAMVPPMFTGGYPAAPMVGMPPMGPMGMPPMGPMGPGGFGFGGPMGPSGFGFGGPGFQGTGGYPFFPGAPGVPPMVNPSLNYL